MQQREHIILLGVDEAGRGSLVGNVVSAAVHLGVLSLSDLCQLGDSKKIGATRRKVLYEKIIACSEVAVGQATAKEIDQWNIHHATLLAMQRAINTWFENNHYSRVAIIIDGKYTPKKDSINSRAQMIQMQAIVKADDLIPCVSAASIIAKVTRDRQMEQLHQQYPKYGFNQHKGYPTKQHKQALLQYGSLEEHRQSYRGVGK